MGPDESVLCEAENKMVFIIKEYILYVLSYIDLLLSSFIVQKMIVIEDLNSCLLTIKATVFN